MERPKPCRRRGCRAGRPLLRAGELRPPTKLCSSCREARRALMRSAEELVAFPTPPGPADEAPAVSIWSPWLYARPGELVSAQRAPDGSLFNLSRWPT